MQLAEANLFWRWSQGIRAEGDTRSTVNHQFKIDMEIRQAEQIGYAKFGPNFLREKRRIFRTDAEGDQCSRIAEHGVANVRVELVTVLMGQDKAHAVFAQLGHHACEHKRGEAVKFVQIDKEGTARGGWAFGAAEGGKAERGDDQAAKDKRTLLAQTAL